MSYFVLLCGLSAVYSGLIYNDFAALSTQNFGKSCYSMPANGGEKSIAYLKDPECVYPFGIDPIWHNSKQLIMFMNGLKMKMSVIYGVMQMSLGTVLKGLNAIGHRDFVELFTVVIPQIALLWVLFGFMDMMIIVKWLTNWTDPKYTNNCETPPSIIAFMI